MNKIWIFLIIISIVFGVINNNINVMVEGLFSVPSETIQALLKIGSMLIIYSGLFQIAEDALVIEKMSRVLKKPVKKIFKLDDPEIIKLISASIIANLLGLGPANMAIAMKIMDKLKDLEKNKMYNVAMYLMINISSLCVLPLSTLTFRATFGSSINVSFIPMLFIASFITTIFAIVMVKIARFDRYNE